MFEQESEEKQMDSNNFLLNEVIMYRNKHNISDPEQKVISMDCALLGWHACLVWLESFGIDVHKAFNSEVENDSKTVL